MAYFDCFVAFLLETEIIFIWDMFIISPLTRE